MEEVLTVTLRITETLEHLGIPYFVAGSLGSSLYGVPRATQDANIVADLQQRHVDDFAQTLEVDFFIERPMIDDAIQHQTSSSGLDPLRSRRNAAPGSLCLGGNG